MRVGILAASLGTLLTLTPLHAQDTPVARATTVIPDSSVWRPLLRQIEDVLGRRIVRSATDTTTQPWMLRTSGSEYPWPEIAAHLTAALKARAVLPMDTAYDELEIRPLSLVGDSATVHVSWRHTTRCANGRTTGWTTLMRIQVVRASTPGRPWSAGRNDPLVHGDGLPCRTRADRAWGIAFDADDVPQIRSYTR